MAATRHAHRRTSTRVRSRRYRAVLAVSVALAAGGMGVALAAPQSSTNPTVTLDITPGDGALLADSQSITVIGAGFQSGGSGVSGQVRQTATLADNSTVVGVVSVPFTSTAGGTFSTTITVTRMFQGLNAQNQLVVVNCATASCFVEAESNNFAFHSRHTISFAAGSTTTTTVAPTTTTTVAPTTTTAAPTTTTVQSTTTLQPATTTTVLSECERLRLARSRFNAQIDANQAAVAGSTLSPAEKAAAAARLEAVRSQGNASFDAGIAASCPPTA